MLDDLGGPAVAAGVKIKAHVAQWAVDQAPPALRSRYLANQAADALAKQTATEGWGFLQYVDQARVAKAEEVKGALTHMADLAEVTEGLAADTTPYVPPPRQQRARRRRPLQHEPVRVERGAKCKRCHRTWVGEGAVAELMRSECPGSVVERIGVPLEWYVTIRGHKLWQNGPWTWCARCGCHSRQRVVGLAKWCSPKTERQSRELGNLRQGKGPRGGPATRCPPCVPARMTLADWVVMAGRDPAAVRAGGGGPVEVHSQEVAA